MFMIKINKSNSITYMGIVFGFMSIYLAISKNFAYDIAYFNYSLIFLVFAGICDMFDGKVARMCKRTDEDKQIGIQLDSLADTINFLCVPVVIMLSLGMTSIFNLIGFIIFIICGISRLAFFNINAINKTSIGYYNGLPVTSVAVIYPVLALIRCFLSLTLFKWIYFITTVVTAILFVCRFRIQKIDKNTYFIISILAIVLVCLLLAVK